MKREEFMTAIAPMLEGAGFRRSRSTWHKQYPDAVAVFNVQASRWEPEYNLNMAIYVRALGEERTPSEYDCHLRRQLGIADRTAEEVFRETIAWLGRNSTFSGMRATIREELDITATPELKKYLSIS